MAISNILTMRASGIALALALVYPAAALAQNRPATPPANSNAAAPDDDAPSANADIVVTGTSIRGEAPVGSSLIQLGRADIEATSATTATQIIREVPQIFSFGVTDSARNQSGGAGNIVYGNSINIRGIGPYATLTLLNGRRPVPQGTLGASVDPGNIPAIALERVEIIADGASAVYGSDAVAGVANLILRRRYDGVGADVQYGWADGYSEFNANMIVGADWGSGRFTLAGQHSYRSALAGVDRDYYRSDLTALGGKNYTTTSCNPGNIQIGATTYAIPAGGATAANLVAGTLNRCDTIKPTDILPQQETNSLSFTLDQEVTDGMRVFIDALWARREGFRRSAVATQTLVVPTTNAFFVAPAGATLAACPASAGVAAGTRCENILYNFAGLFPGGVATSAIQSDVWQITGGVDFDLSDTWHLNNYYTFGKDHDHVYSVGTGVDAANLAAALRSADPATALNPFGTAGGNSAATIASVFDNLTDTDGRASFIDAGISMNGALFALP
ncbi:MAG: TonB-dependent receptor plug domain-containing protein, partial [Sphingopyxis sp.]